MTQENIANIRQRIMDEMKRVASFADGSPELAEFNARLKSRVIQQRRALSKFVNSPPGFGFRNSDSGWMTHLQDLNRTPGFRKSVTLKPELAEVDKLLDAKENAWRPLVARWKLADVKPYAVAAKPAPQLIARTEQEAAARAAAELARLKTKYNVTDEQEALRRFKTEYDAETAALEKLANQASSFRFVEKPPLTLDDQLDYKATRLDGGVPLVSSTFENMTSATTGVALRLDGVPEDKLVYVSALPALISQTGVIKDGKAVSFEEMSEALRKEILALNVYFSTNFGTNRAELVVRGAGNDRAESERAVEWMRLVLQSPNWRADNLARIRDVVDQTLSGLRNRMQGSEESWVNDPADAYWRQDNPLLLASSSFLTRAHNVHRLRWMLRDAGSAAERDAISDFLTKLSTAKGSRDELKNLLAAMRDPKADAAKVPAGLLALKTDAFDKLPEGAKAHAVEAAKDLDQLLADIPDASLAADWEYLAKQIRHDLLTSPEKTLADLDALRKSLLKTGGARVFMIGSRATQAALEPKIVAMMGEFEKAPHAPVELLERAARRVAPARAHGRKGRARPRRPDEPEHAGRRLPQLRAVGLLRGRGEPRPAARLPRLAPLRGLRRARRLHQDVGRGAGLLERLPRLALHRSHRLLRRAHAGAAADPALRHRRAEEGQARPRPRRVRHRAGVPAVPLGLALRGARRADGRRPRRRHRPRRGAPLPRGHPRAAQRPEPHRRTLQAHAAGLRPASCPATASRRRTCAAASSTSSAPRNN